tara:strand:- start:1894 stop:2343 length:450 start_codon:yes stop_codon:yes gene_type:complete
MPETHNNEDIGMGFLHDFETRVWVNCNWITDYVENLEKDCCEPCNADYKKQVGIFEHLNNEQHYRFWKDFNYHLQNDERFRLPNYYEGKDLPNDSTLEAIREIWCNLIIELEEDEYRDNCWNIAMVDFEKEQKEKKVIFEMGGKDIKWR